MKEKKKYVKNIRERSMAGSLGKYFGKLSRKEILKDLRDKKVDRNLVGQFKEGLEDIKEGIIRRVV